jgi:hypothetical protein
MHEDLCFLDEFIRNFCHSYPDSVSFLGNMGDGKYLVI